MNNNIWYDLKLKFLRSGSPAMAYIGLNVLIFVVVGLAGVVCFLMGQRGFVDGLVYQYMAFPSNPELWLSRFYTLITYQFFHAGFFHILFNMLWLYWMGQLLLDFIKPRQFHVIYLGGGIVGAIFFALIFNLIPAFKEFVGIPLVGASACVMAVMTALATLVPNYEIRLLFVGNIKMKYLLLAYIILDLIGTADGNAGGSLAHLGGALFGFVYIKLLQNGYDMSSVFKRRPKLKVVRNENVKKNTNAINQHEIDAILDKISKSGYDKLSKEEKETLFKASKN
ncbi:rhomboid family intramembrane serine protease [Pedobacter sp. KR3-3]|uniref:Rhomboid family intramembrane serine protease n=1 Tax=Pedobacter albus TaxID=3113905 RepID=A0ABU7IC79_9SPHI|nr:rhomboid family intramembrane serine protease [Pedobacter sp. KR3-3]MEE1947072.1 rhomboid family intramembrane serine protease [Pedobacter sp. KR3-3]